MGSDANDAAPGPEVPVVSIPDIRDYQRINVELASLLDQGHKLVRLACAEGQRLLVAGLSGLWSAVVEVEGQAGPELAASLNAPNLTVVCRGPAADGAGRGMIAGDLLILGDAGPAVGYAQRGGAILVNGSAGPRAGLEQSGGVLILNGKVGCLAGERQSGGWVFTYAHLLGPHSSRGQREGRFIAWSQENLPDMMSSTIQSMTIERFRAYLPGSGVVVDLDDPINPWLKRIDPFN